MQRSLMIILLSGLLFSGSVVFAQYDGTGDLKIDKPSDKEDVQSTPPPEGAVVLFGGQETDLAKWTQMDGKSPIKWIFTNGAMQVKGGNILSKEQLDGHFKLHVEFRIPYQPGKKGQADGNSGIYVQGRYEIQVLNAYHNETYKDGMCGAIYTIEPPSQNVAKAPTVWQAYDIEFKAPKFENGKKVEPGTMTVFWNGVKVHDNTKLTKDNTTAGRGGDPSKPGPLMLQDHGNPVQFRNIWVQQLK